MTKLEERNFCLQKKNAETFTFGVIDMIVVKIK
jgi:hypothetical protein